MYDDDEFEFDDDELDEYPDESDSYERKGKEDRSYVDQQAKDYDEEKRKKRVALAQLRQKLLALRSDISRRERELRDLDIALEKEEYREIKERVIADRKALADGETISAAGVMAAHEPLSAPGMEMTGTDVEVGVMTLEMQKRMARESHKKKRDDIQSELSELAEKANLLAREVSTLEHTLQRS